MIGSSLSLQDYKRYGRQMILQEMGLPGQQKLLESSVLVVGAGGLGCPTLQYLAAAGVGHIGIVDHDTVDLSNLQRQTLHTESRVGMSKAESAAIALKEINSSITIKPYLTALTPLNAVSLLQSYGVVLDCSDNAPTRYLLSDTCVQLNKPLVSGAAMKFDGQLCVYNLGENGPCYRCLYPKPPRPEEVGSCEERGVLGAVTGVIGALQALECVKLITGMNKDNKPSLLIYSALSTTPFRSVKLRFKRPTCPACGVEGEKIGKIEELDYVAFCGGTTPDYEKMGLEAGEPGCRVEAKEMQAMVENEDVHIIDVRPPVEYGICHLPSSINIPLAELIANPSSHLADTRKRTIVICRLGNDSQIAADALRASLAEAHGTDGQEEVLDLRGGLRAWSRDVDIKFPIY